jgi:hypothetical protein
MTGYLVDANCYRSMQSNSQKSDRAVNTSHDQEVRECTPAPSTKNYGLVSRQDSRLFELDAAGSAKAADLVRQHPNETPFMVTVQGPVEGKTLHVNSITQQK